MRNSNARVLKNAFFLTILQAINLLAPFILIPYLTRILGVEEFGAVMVAISMTFFAYIVTDYGFSISSTYYISKNRQNKNGIQNHISRVFSAKIPLTLVSIITILVISYLPSYYTYREIFWASLPAIVFQAYQPLWLFHGLEQMRDYTIYMTLTKIAYVLLVLLFVHSPNDGSIVLVCWSTSQLLGFAASIAMMKSLGYSFSLASLTSAIDELRSSAPFFVSRLAVAVYTAASSFIVGLSSLHQAALYACAEQFYKAGQAVTTPIRQALYPHMANEKNWDLFFRVLPIMSAILAAGSFIVYLYRDFFISLIFGPAYLDASPVLGVFLITLLVNYIGISFGYPACAAIERTDIANNSVLVGVVVFTIIIAGLYITERINALNVALAVLTTESTVALLRIALVMKTKKHYAQS